MSRREDVALSVQPVQAVDNEWACWPFLFYHLDIRQLSLQLTGGKPGSAAVEAAEKLMGKKHSIFVARYVCHRNSRFLVVSFQSPMKSQRRANLCPVLLVGLHLLTAQMRVALLSRHIGPGSSATCSE